MLEYIYALSMVFMEMLFLFVVLLALYHQRKVIGDSAFLMIVALLFAFDRWVAAADIRVVLWGTTTFHVAEVAIGLPALATFLLIYIMQGVLAAQRVLLGIIVSFLIYIYIGQITRLQCGWTGYSIFPGLYGGALEALLSSGRMTVNVLAVSHFFELFCLPMIYSRFMIWGISRRWAIMLALPGALLAGMLPQLASGVAGGSIFQVFNGDFYARLAGIVILAILLVIYIERFEAETTDTRVGVLDFVFAFFGSYGRLQETEKHLLEWQNRFHAVFDYSTEIIVTCDDRGRIMDCNIAAKKLFRMPRRGSGNGQFLQKLIEVDGGQKLDLKSTFHAPKHFECTVELEEEKKALLQASIFPVQMHRQLIFVMTARDVTAEREFAREREALTEQLNHSQRLESLGILAGGIAHDFNNCIHAILGYVDAAAFFDRGNPEALEKHLAKIGKIAEQAGKLTQQMLGFARRGKYHVVNIRLKEMFEQCRMLISPQKLAAIDFEVTLPPEDFIIAADSFQIQQVLINMLLNAVDALKGNVNAKLELFAVAGADSPVKFAPPPGDRENENQEDYLAIVIRDNGCGMPPEVASRIFEPFFTTKPVGSGTGMGLSMAHGIIANHKGWIQLDSIPGKGTTFAIFLHKAVGG
ncbi:MAG: hypothetical protein IJY46_03450 [Lentisphaeria bacterium]|nr:hypothetical protein [Lentisphaeria bacterium]